MIIPPASSILNFYRRCNRRHCRLWKDDAPVPPRDVSMLARTAEIPPHVPHECVLDVDLYQMPGAEQDFLIPWKRLQDAAPSGLVWTPRNGGHWIVTRGHDIARIYADHENFSSNITIVPREWGERYPLRPTTVDPPGHRPYRQRINAALSKRRVHDALPHIRQLVIEAVERVRVRGRCEFIRDFAESLPTRIFLHLADLPAEAANRLPRYAEDPRDTRGSSGDLSVMDRYAALLRPYVAERRYRPGNDLLSELVAVQPGGPDMSEDEAVEMATAMLTGGLDTVISTLALIMAFLSRHPAHRQRLIEDARTIRPAVAEMLRRFPIMTKARVLKTDQVISGVTLKAGDMMVLPPLHGLDDREFPDPLTVDFDRPAAAHSTFGNGVHRCPGSVLTHAQLEIALKEWLARIPHFEIDASRPPRMRGGVLGAVLDLHLHWEP